jgi:hypothetical protein
LIKVVVGFASGGGRDVYARSLARHFGKYISGNPILAVQNMPVPEGCAQPIIPIRRMTKDFAVQSRRLWHNF